MDRKSGRSQSGLADRQSGGNRLLLDRVEEAESTSAGCCTEIAIDLNTGELLGDTHIEQRRTFGYFPESDTLGYFRTESDFLQTLPLIAFYSQNGSAEAPIQPMSECGAIWPSSDGKYLACIRPVGTLAVYSVDSSR